MSSGVVHTFTVIRVGAGGRLEEPYAIAIVDTDGGRRSARVDGELEWLAVGAPATLEEDGGIVRARPGKEPR